MNVNNFSKYSLLSLNTDKEKDSVKSSTLPFPSFSGYDGFTKAAPSMNEEEYTNAIIEQAKKDAAKGVCGNTSGNNSEYLSLRKSFMCVVSPDRKGLVTQTNKNLMKKNKGSVSFAQLFTKSGEEVGNYSSKYGWRMTLTKSEISRGQSFNSTYVDAWNKARAEIDGKLSSKA